MPVTKDATSGMYIPQSNAEWTDLLVGTGIANPTSLWLCQEASGTLADSIGANSLAPFSGPLYQQTIAGWASKAVAYANTNSALFTSTLGNPSVASFMAFGWVDISATPTDQKSVFYVGAGGSEIRIARVTTAPHYEVAGTGQLTGTGSANPGTTVRPVLFQIDITAGAINLQTDQETISPIYTAPLLGTPYFQLGGDGSSGDASAQVSYLYAAAWSGPGAKLSSGQRATLLSRLQSGPPPVTVTKDATSGKYIPASADEWTALLAGTGFANPSNAWGMQAASGTQPDLIGSLALSAAGVRVDYAQTIAGWSRKGARSRGDEWFTNDASLPDPSAVSQLVFAWMIPETPSGAGAGQNTASLSFHLGTGTQHYVNWDADPSEVNNLVSNGVTTAGTKNPVGSVHGILVQNTFAENKARIVSDQETIEHATASTDASKYLWFNGGTVASGACSYLYIAYWSGAAAELTAPQLATLLSRLQNGPPASGRKPGRNGQMLSQVTQR